MGKSLAEAFPVARAVFDEVDAALGEKLTSLIWDGPGETLQLTENAQPALMAVSLATMRVLESEAGFSVARHAAFVAGHSLGEYSALAAAGSLAVGDTARLLRTRGLAMQKAVPVGVGAMAALLGLDYETAVAVADEAAQGQVCQAANDNGGGQVVVSGDKAAVERAVEIAKTKGAKRAMLLPVSAPFHCRLMQPAADAMAQALAGVAIKPPAAPVVSNVLAAPISKNLLTPWPAIYATDSRQRTVPVTCSTSRRRISSGSVIGEANTFDTSGAAGGLMATPASACAIASAAGCIKRQ